jgi:hypothetical protein
VSGGTAGAGTRTWTLLYDPKDEPIEDLRWHVLSAEQAAAYRWPPPCEVVTVVALDDVLAAVDEWKLRWPVRSTFGRTRFSGPQTKKRRSRVF